MFISTALIGEYPRTHSLVTITAVFFITIYDPYNNNKPINITKLVPMTP
jgi:hypothetical protein